MAESPQIPSWIQDSSQLAVMTNYLVTAYNFLNWHTDERENFLFGELPPPEFIRAALGPPLKHLPTYNRDETERKEASGLGSLLDIAHREMRNLGKAVGEAFRPELEKIGMQEPPPASCPFASALIDFEGQNTAKAMLKADGKNVPVNLKGGEIALKGISAYIGSRAILQRPGRESKIIETQLGLELQAYRATATLAANLLAAIKDQHPEYANLDLADLGLDLQRKPQIARRAAEALPQARAAYNMCVSVTGNIDQTFSNWVSERETKPAAQLIYTTTPGDIASVVHSLNRFLIQPHIQFPLDIDFCRSLVTNIAAAENMHSAAQMLNEPRARLMLEKLETYYEHLAIEGGGAPLHEPILDELVKWRDRELGIGKYPGKPVNEVSK